MHPPYLIAIVPPPDIYSKITAVQEQYRTPSWKRRIGPHVTLLTRFRYSGTLQELLEALSLIAQQQPAFPIFTTQINAFSHKHSVIYVSVESKEIYTLQHKIYLAIQPNDTNIDDFHPHITLSNKLDADTFAVQWPELAKREIHYTWQCREFFLFTLDHDGCWQNISSFTLR